MSTNNLERTPVAKSGASPSMAVSPSMALNGTAHPSDAPELDVGQYYVQLALCMCLSVGYIVTWTLLYGSGYTNNIFAALAKVVLMGLVAYLPGRGPLMLTSELSDICQWILLIAAMAITIFICKTDMGLFGTAVGLICDCLSCWFAIVWKSWSRARKTAYLPHRLIAALFQRQGANQGEDYA
ncbi:hypothetical protein C8F01DRAFT_1371928 [Mycena amicta]|nr:hypothetical protein C8F01DRAFT_1371928 [Mycena amicta]